MTALGIFLGADIEETLLLPFFDPESADDTRSYVAWKRANAALHVRGTHHCAVWFNVARWAAKRRRFGTFKDEHRAHAIFLVVEAVAPLAFHFLRYQVELIRCRLSMSVDQSFQLQSPLDRYQLSSGSQLGGRVWNTRVFVNAFEYDLSQLLDDYPSGRYPSIVAPRDRELFQPLVRALSSRMAAVHYNGAPLGSFALNMRSLHKGVFDMYVRAYSKPAHSMFASAVVTLVVQLPACIVLSWMEQSIREARQQLDQARIWIEHSGTWRQVVQDLRAGDFHRCDLRLAQFAAEFPVLNFRAMLTSRFARLIPVWSDLKAQAGALVSFQLGYDAFFWFFVYPAEDVNLRTRAFGRWFLETSAAMVRRTQQPHDDGLAAPDLAAHVPAPNANPAIPAPVASGAVMAAAAAVARFADPLLVGASCGAVAATLQAACVAINGYGLVYAAFGCCLVTPAGGMVVTGTVAYCATSMMIGTDKAAGCIRQEINRIRRMVPW